MFRSQPGWWLDCDFAPCLLRRARYRMSTCCYILAWLIGKLTHCFYCVALGRYQHRSPLRSVVYSFARLPPAAPFRSVSVGPCRHPARRPRERPPQTSFLSIAQPYSPKYRLPCSAVPPLCVGRSFPRLTREWRRYSTVWYQPAYRLKSLGILWIGQSGLFRNRWHSSGIRRFRCGSAACLKRVRRDVCSWGAWIIWGEGYQLGRS